MSADSRSDAWIGRTIDGQFRVERMLGGGGMGSVYVAEQLGVERKVVVKVIRAALTEDPTVVERFRRESKIVARLSHPNIVQVYTAGETPEGAHYLVMELADGVPLDEEMRRNGALGEQRSLQIALQIAEALAAAHAAGVVHRDLKPANVILTRLFGGRELVKVLDFGIAKLVEQADDGPGLTGSGVIVGTPAYMSPEQVKGSGVDGRSDLYTLGVILYEMLAGKHPYEAETPVQFILQHLQQPMSPPSVRTPGLSISTETELVLGMLTAKDPAERYPSADAAASALRRASELANARAGVLGASGAPTSLPPSWGSAGGAPTSPPPAWIEPGGGPGGARAAAELTQASRRGAGRAIAAVIGLAVLLFFGVGTALHLALSAGAGDGDKPDPSAAGATEAAGPTEAAPAAEGAPTGAEPGPATAAPTPAASGARPPGAKPRPAEAAPASLVPGEQVRGVTLPRGARPTMNTTSMVVYRVDAPVRAVAAFFGAHPPSARPTLVNDDSSGSDPSFSMIFSDAPGGLAMVSVISDGPQAARINLFLR